MGSAAAAFKGFSEVICKFGSIRHLLFRLSYFLFPFFGFYFSCTGFSPDLLFLTFLLSFDFRLFAQGYPDPCPDHRVLLDFYNPRPLLRE
jgi:hypothetical protein